MSENHSHDRDDVAGEITPMDEELALTADFLSGQATPEQAADFKRRLI